MRKLSLQEAIMELVSRENMNGYRLAKILGCTSGHIYHIKKGKVDKTNSILAWAIYSNFNILVDNYESPEILEAIYKADMKRKGK